MADPMHQGKNSIVMLTRGNTIKVSVEDPEGNQVICNLQKCEEICDAGSTVLVAPPGSAATHFCRFKDTAAKMAMAAAHHSILQQTTQNGGAKLVGGTPIDGVAPRSVQTGNSASGKFCFGKGRTYWLLLIACSSILLVGTSSATLLGRLYFTHGGSQRWLYTCMQSAGWPLLIPFLLAYYASMRSHSCARPTQPSFKLLTIYLAMGFFTAFDNLLFSWGLSYLPVSTNSLLCASQLAFNAVFAYAIVGQKLTHFIVNSVFSITMGAVLLGLHAGSDRPAGTTEKQYILGFVVTIGGAALYALMLPLLELTYKKVIGKTSFAVVMEAQIAIATFATLFAILGMWINGDFGRVAEEARSFGLGRSLYTVTLVGSAVGWQMFFLGGAGIVFLASSLLSCVFATAMLPLLSLLAVIFFDDSFSALKAVAMLLSIWGFVSYIYGGYLEFKSKSSVVEPDLAGDSV